MYRTRPFFNVFLNRCFTNYSQRLYSTPAKTVNNRIESPVSKVLKFSVGDELFGYRIKQVEKIPELQLAAVRLIHDKTGADHLHIARDDQNNLFSVALRTTPQDSKGIMHILEHITLCGSQMYPVREVFTKMLSRSLSTFMNAYTGSDFTMFLFSTQNPKDFENLLRVYCDLTFFPCLRKEDFWQEGWRLEHEDVNDINSPIVFKGVVFNEMKGVFSDSNQLFVRCLLNKLFPISYPHESGGDPIHIPKLTLTELKQYHAEYYHPSNSRFFTYGDLPLEMHLKSIEEFILCKFSKIDVKSGVKEEVPWGKPKEEHISCRFDPMAAVQQKQTTASVSYLLNDTTDTYESFALSIIGNLLVDGPNSPFYKSLLEPGIGADYSPWTGHEGSLKRGFFSVGLREIANDDVNLVKGIIDSTIKNVIRDGFPKKQIEGVLHNIELAIKHQTTKFGHNATLSILSNWIHGGNPISSLQVNNHIHWFRKQLYSNPYFLQEKVSQYLKENSHKLGLVMSPDVNYESRLLEAEKKLLASKLVALTEEDKKKLFREGQELLKYCKKPEDLSCLPTLQISDVQSDIENTCLQTKVIGNVPIQICEQPTNGVTYFSAFSEVTGLPDDLLMLLPLFSTIVTKMGAGANDFKSLDQLAALKTGGLNASVHMFDHPSTEGDFQLGVIFSSHSLQKNVYDMMKLWEDIFNSLTLSDKHHLLHLIKLTATEVAQDIPSNGHKYCMLKASSFLNLQENMKERLFGLTQVSYLKKLAESNKCDEVAEKLKSLSNIILSKDHLRCSVNACSDSMSSSLSSVESFINSLRADKVNNNISAEWSHLNVAAADNKYHFVLPFDVNYLGKSIMTVPYCHKDFATLKVLSKLLTLKFLHSEVREKGGAYGVGSALKISGAFAFYSYRDPHLLQTLSSFDASAHWLLHGNYSKCDVDEAKLGVFSEVDYPVAPGNKGSLQFLHGITDEMKRILRARLFAVTKDDIVDVTNRYLLNTRPFGIALIGREQEITKNNSDWVVHIE